MKTNIALICLLVLVPMSPAAFAQQESESGGQDAAELAKAAQNPVGSLISLPFQNNMNFDVGPDDRTQNVMNIQPVYPFSLNDDWNLVTRTILPVISQPAPGTDRTNGIGDLNISLFFAPKKPGKWVWGAGPILFFPTASDDVLGTDKYSAGASLVVLTMPGNWVVGGLVSQWWSYAGDDDAADDSSFLLQPIINYNYPGGWYLTSVPIITANWEADSGDQWTVPLGGGIGKIVKFDNFPPLNISTQFFYNVVKPTGGADWTWRFQFQLMWPK